MGYRTGKLGTGGRERKGGKKGTREKRGKERGRRGEGMERFTVLVNKKSWLRHWSLILTKWSV